MTNTANTVLYTGMTNDLRKRAFQHREKLVDGFTKRYNLTKLVYYELFGTAMEAITREKQIKGGSHKKKRVLVMSLNPAWEDLYESL